MSHDNADERLKEWAHDRIRSADMQAAFREVLDSAMELTGAQFANLRLRTSTGLVLVAHRNLKNLFLRHFDVVRHGEGACGRAMQSNQPYAVPDVTSSDSFTEESRRVLLETGCRAVHSVPVSLGEVPLGVLSVHWNEPRDPHHIDSIMLDAVSEHLARMLEPLASFVRRRGGETA